MPEKKKQYLVKYFPVSQVGTCETWLNARSAEGYHLTAMQAVADGFIMVLISAAYFPK